MIQPLELEMEDYETKDFQLWLSKILNDYHQN